MADKNFSRSVPLRKRGRPAGHNRAPLSVEERRARNAFYEKERRQEFAHAVTDLARALGCNENVTNNEVIATAVHYLQRSALRGPDDDLGTLQRIHGHLLYQIDLLSSRLGVEISDDESEDSSPPLSEPTTESLSSNNDEQQYLKAEDLATSYDFTEHIDQELLHCVKEWPTLPDEDLARYLT